MAAWAVQGGQNSGRRPGNRTGQGGRQRGAPVLQPLRTPVHRFPLRATQKAGRQPGQSGARPVARPGRGGGGPAPGLVGRGRAWRGPRALYGRPGPQCPATLDGRDASTGVPRPAACSWGWARPLMSLTSADVPGAVPGDGRGDRLGRTRTAATPQPFPRPLRPLASGGGAADPSEVPEPTEAAVPVGNTEDSRADPYFIAGKTEATGGARVGPRRLRWGAVGPSRLHPTHPE